MNKYRDVIERGYIEIKYGLVLAVREGEPESVCPQDLDARGADVYPGFIDAHTHLGLTTNGVGIESEDFNEESSPCSAKLRIIDAVNPFDTSFEKARSAGITAAVISPGSMNPVAGDIIAVSTLGKRIDKMLLRTVGIKFALGENPKMTYMNRDETPASRMATAAIIREALAKAVRYGEDISNAEESSDMPELDMDSGALLPLLKRKLKAHFHCHRADDIFTALRISREFDLDCVLIHCTDGHLIADELAREGCPAVIGPIICDPCKPELANITPANAGILANAGVKTAICTDHSETPIEYLTLTAGIAIKHGMSFEQALEAVTINAAEAAGIDDICGSLEAGKRADIVIFEKGSSPFEVLSSPKEVFIGGERVRHNFR